MADILQRMYQYILTFNISIFDIVDVTIIAQKPKLKDYMPRMVESLQAALPGARINVKATTTEKLGFEGRGEGISAQAVASIW